MQNGFVRSAATVCLRVTCKGNLIDMTACYHTVNGVIRIKIEHVFRMITSY